MPSLMSRFDLTPKDIIRMIGEVYHVEISDNTARFALAKSLSKVFEDWEISYATLPRYLQYVKDSIS